MTDDRRPTRVSDEDEGSIESFSGRHGITEEQTRALIREHGNDYSIVSFYAAEARANQEGSSHLAAQGQVHDAGDTST